MINAKRLKVLLTVSALYLLQTGFGQTTLTSHKNFNHYKPDLSLKQLSVSQKKLDTELLQLTNSKFLPAQTSLEQYAANMEKLGKFKPSLITNANDRIADGQVYVYITYGIGSLKPVERFCQKIISQDKKNRLLAAWVKINQLEALASKRKIKSIHSVYAPVILTGSVMSEGDAIHRTAEVRSAFNQTGEGVKIGVISNGVDTRSAAQATGDLPADGSGLTVLRNTSGGEEGTAMMEIIHDMVPGADLYFHDAGSNVIEFTEAIDNLVASGCKVICDDIGWIVEPFFEDGIVASHLTSTLERNDLVYVSSAGNAGKCHYQGNYSSYNNGTNHDFSHGSSSTPYLYLNMPKGSTATIVLQWNDLFGTAENDYDLYLVNMITGSMVAYSASFQDGNDDPLEAFSYKSSSSADYALIVDKYSGDIKTLEVFIYPNGSEVYTNNITPVDAIFGHAAVPATIAAGAISASDAGNDEIESYSSQGPVTISFPSSVTRSKPDLCGIDGVTVTGAGGFSNPFYGTSAAAPHIAAIAAQLWAELPGADGQEIKNMLCTSSIDLGSPGLDHIYGYGRADALNAFNQNFFISVLAPNGGEDWQIETSHNITWTSRNTSGYVRIEYSVDSGSTWLDVSASTPDDGLYTWLVPDAPSTKCLIKISDIDGIPADTGNAIFTISELPVIALTSPNGGERWKTGSSHDITWISNNTSGNVRIEYSLNNGTAWFDVIASTPDDGSYAWIVPGSHSKNCLVRVSDTDGSPSDNSNAAFTLTTISTVHFTPVWDGNGVDHMNFFTITARIDGLDMQAGDEIGIFDGGICVGSGLLTGVVDANNILEIHVSRDDEITSEIDGYTVGNTASFKLWNFSEEREIEHVEITYVSGDNTFAVGASTIYSINGISTLDQNITLNNGWNIFSLYVTPDNPAMISVVQPLITAGSLLKVQNESGSALEYLTGYGWYNSIGQWLNTEGYKIRVNAATSLTVTGEPIDLPLAIPLSSGWNIFAYPVPSSQNAMTAVNELINAGSLLKVQNESGNALEYLTGYGWYDNITNLLPGEGYKIRVNASSTLNINGAGKAASSTVNNTGIETARYFSTCSIGNGLDHMNIYLDPAGSGLQTGDEIGIYDGDICVGAGRITDPDLQLIAMTASADDPATASKDGFTEGNILQLKVWRLNTGNVHIPDIIEYLDGTENRFEAMGTAILKIASSPDGLEYTDVPLTGLGDCYPNPFNQSTNIPYTIGEETQVEIAIYDVLGQKVDILARSAMKPGSYSLVWNGAGRHGVRMTPGIYVCRMMVNDNVFVKTMEMLGE
jgi:hypothetical protein